MAISANYPVPVYVNGYACNNCAQVAEAKQGVNPADPQAGPYGVDATSSSAQGGASPGAAGARSPAVIFGGALSNQSSASGAANGSQPAPNSVAQPSGPGGLLNISV